MKDIDVFGPAMCCSSGVCGSDVDQDLVDFNGALNYARKEGIHIRRHNLATDPSDFAESDTIRKFLQISGSEGLPAIVVDDTIVLSCSYPTLSQLRRFAGAADEAPRAELPLMNVSGTSAGGECCCEGEC